MKTLGQIKDEVAKENGFDTWDSLEAKFDKLMLSYAWQDVCKDYAQQACEDLRERIAENATTKYIRYDNPSGVFHGEDVVDREQIRNTEIILP